MWDCRWVLSGLDGKKLGLISTGEKILTPFFRKKKYGTNWHIKAIIFQFKNEQKFTHVEKSTVHMMYILYDVCFLVFTIWCGCVSEACIGKSGSWFYSIFWTWSVEETGFELVKIHLLLPLECGEYIINSTHHDLHCFCRFPLHNSLILSIEIWHDDCLRNHKRSCFNDLKYTRRIDW